MKINRHLAEQIQQKAHAILKREIVITDSGGQVLAGGQTDYQAPEALRACQEGQPTRGVMKGLGELQWYPFVYEQQTIGALGIVTAGLEVAPEAINLLQGLAEVIVHQGFLQERMRSNYTIRSEFIRDLLEAAAIQPDEIWRQVDILQLNLRQPQVVILLHLQRLERQLAGSQKRLSIEEQEAKLAEAIEKISLQIRKILNCGENDYIVYLGRDCFAWLAQLETDSPNTLNTIRQISALADSAHQALPKIWPAAVTIGVGQYYPDLGGLRKSYQDAKLALEVGSKVWGNNRVYHIKSVGMFVTLAHVSQGRKAELAHQILNPLVRDQQLFKTVQVFLASGLNLTEAANKLHVHRNTLIYRLDKTKKLIGLDPRHFDDALQIKLGLMFY